MTVRSILSLSLAAGLTTAFAACSSNQSREEVSAYTMEMETMNADCQAAFQAMLAVDPSLQERFYQTCHAYAVFPKVGRFGIGIGGASGEGLVYRAWNTVVGGASIEQVTVGAQVGGQTFREIIFFQDAATLNRFMASPQELSANISAILVKNGAGASNNYVNGVAVFVQPTDGLMLEMSIGGQKFIYRGANKQ